jgi:hypothetical protein
MLRTILTRRPGQISRARRFGFLLGVGKSGTNWVGSLLNLHPRILCNGEFHFQYFFEAHQRFTSGWWLAGNRPEIARASRAALEHLIRQSLLAAASEKPAANLIIDRTPRPFEVLLPGAPHLYLLRDGRDTLISFTFHQLRTAPPENFPVDMQQWYAPHYQHFQQDPGSITRDNPGLLGEEHWVRYHARRWAEQTRHDFAAIAALQDSAGIHATPVLTLRYEDLHAATDEWRTRMYQFLDLDPAEAAPLSPGSRTTPGFNAENRTSFYRKGQVGDWKTFASDNFRRWFKDEAGQALIDLGYESSSNW